MAAAVAVGVVTLFFATAPYGRYSRPGWGPAVPSRVGWILMEAVSLIVMTLTMLAGSNRQPLTLLFWGLWTIHYINRSVVWPCRARLRGRTMPLSVVVMAMGFNLVNAWLNGTWLFSLKDGGYETGWALAPQCIVGLVLFVFGMVLNVSSDGILFRLRESGATGYKIPRGGLFRYVSCPNYLGEILEWTGWALATWSPAGLSFAVWTIANLAPRALAHHEWYRRNFNDYPPGRKALVPFVV